MKKLSALILIAVSSLSQASTLLERAINCELQDEELKNLIQTIAVHQSEFKKPALELAAPSVNLYELEKPITVFGFTAETIAVMPGRVMLAVSGTNKNNVTKKLNLIEEEYSPSSKTVRPTVSVVAFNLSHSALQGKTLVGCEYASPAAASWIQDGPF